MSNTPQPSQAASEAWQDVQATAGNLRFLDGPLQLASRIEARFYLAVDVEHARAADAQQLEWFQKRTTWYDQQIAVLGRVLDDRMQQIAALRAEKEHAQACMNGLIDVIKEVMGQGYKDAVTEACGDISVNTAFRVALREERERHKDAIEEAEAQLTAEQAQWQQEEQALVKALKAVTQTDDDCPVCDRGRLRNPEKTHWPECPFGKAQTLLAALTAQQEIPK